MQTSYRAIFTEILRAEAAAIGAFAEVATRFAALMGGEYQSALVWFSNQTQPGVDNAGPSSQPDGPPHGEFPLASANFCRGLAGLPRVSMMTFLSQYDDLRGRRGS